MSPTFCNYILQKRQGQFWGFHFLILVLNCNKVSVTVSVAKSQEAIIPKFLNCSNLNFQGLCEVIPVLVQQNLDFS